jgi:bifunctional non-homologous end joining protein LigD
MQEDAAQLPEPRQVHHQTKEHTMPPSSVQTVSLYFKQGSSDKEYHATIQPEGDCFVVTFAYGRRGSTLQTGTKTTNPVDLATATGIFTKLVAEKKAKGYTEGPGGTPYQHTPKEDRFTNILPQLLNPVDESELDPLIEHDAWCAQEKLDGKRILLRKEGAAIHGVNRKGLLVGLPSPVVADAHVLPGDFILDGESVGERLHVFDLLALDGENMRPKPYADRSAALVNLITSRAQRRILLTETAWNRDLKRKLLSRLRGEKKEGIVFKRMDAPYVAGRPAGGGTQLKHKFYATLSALVGAINAKRSIEIKLFNDRGLVSAGNVTVPPNHPIPKVGQVVEVRYLYAYRGSGSVYQPVYQGARSDIAKTECTTAQLKFKSEEE